MLRRARYCYGKLSDCPYVRLSVRYVEVPWSHRLKILKINSPLVSLGCSLSAEAHWCEQLAGVASAMHRPGVEPATSRVWITSPTPYHYTTKPPVNRPTRQFRVNGRRVTDRWTDGQSAPAEQETDHSNWSTIDMTHDLWVTHWILRRILNVHPSASEMYNISW